MALGVRGEIRSIIPHYAGQLGGFPTRGKEKVFAPYDFLSLKSLPHPKLLELLMVYLPLSTVEGISSGIRGTLGGLGRGGFPTGSEQQVPGAPTWDIGQRARQLPMHQHLLISRQPLLFFYVDGFPPTWL